MPIKCYLQGPEPTDANERRAFCRVARLLHEQYRHADDTLLLIANLVPDYDPRLAAHGLPQLDGLLLAPGLVAILEFKNYYQPFRAQDKNGRWPLQGRHRGQYVAGGSRRNPYLQAVAAKKKWVTYLEQAAPGQPWSSLHSFVLFHPYLHEESQLPALGKDGYWLHFRSIDHISELVFANHARGIVLSGGQMHRLAFETLHARPWPDIEGLLSTVLGYLYLSEPDTAVIKLPVYAFDEFTLGRRPHVHRIALANSRVSRDQLRVAVRETAVRVYDLDSKNGSYLNGRRLDSEQGALLQSGDRLYLGGQQLETATQLWFEPLPSRSGQINLPLPYTETSE